MEVDGLRGIAILLVMLFHFTIITEPITFLDVVVFKVAMYGWSGVNLFFVLSGFLITGILINAKGQAHFFRNFYIRRALRILPLYYALVIALLFVYPMVGRDTLRAEAELLKQDQWWIWTHMVNWLMVRTGSWGTPLMTAGFWSLSIEEQFYFIWPLIIYFCPRQLLFKLCLSLLVLTIATRVMMVLAGASPLAVSIVTFAHLDPLIIGAMLAILAQDRYSLSKLRSSAGIVALLSATVFVVFEIVKSRLPQLDAAILIPSLTAQSFFWGTLLVFAISSSSESYLSKLLRCRFLVVLGVYSYALYLLHGHIIRPYELLGIKDMAKGKLIGSPLPGQIMYWALAISASVVVSYASWHIYEKQFLKLKRFFPSGSVIANDDVIGSDKAKKSHRKIV